MQYNIHNPEGVSYVPIVLVGLVVAPPVPVGGFRRDEHHREARLFDMRFRVENVLQGAGPAGEIDIFFYRGATVSPTRTAMYFPLGDREILFLQRDCRYLRTVCDDWADCSSLRVFSGSHPDYKRDPSKPLSRAITDILATNGKGVTDRQFANALLQGRHLPYGRYETMEALKQIANRQHSLYKASACRILAFNGALCY